MTTANLVAFQTANPGLEYVIFADIIAGGTTDLYTRDRFGNSGTATSDSDLDFDTDDHLILLRTRNAGTGMQLNDDSNEFRLDEFFDPGGDGNDLTVYLMLASDTSTTYSFPIAGNIVNTGNGFVNLDVPSAPASAWDGIDTGDQFVFAMARVDPNVNHAPSFAESSYDRSVDENALIGANVGTAITATDDDGDTLTYELSGTGAADFHVSSAGQITAAVATLDHETTDSYTLTLTADDGNGGEDTATVNITINDLDERPSLTPDPSGSTWHTNNNEEFTVSNTPGIQAVRITETVDTGNLTLHSTSAGLTCSNQTNTLQVSSADSFWTRFCDAGTVNLRVEDRDDATNYRDYTVTMVSGNNAPAFDASVYYISVDENVPGRTSVGSAITAEDSDDDTLSYSLSGTGSDNCIVSSSGQVQTSAGFSPNAESADSYTLTLTADDGNGGSDTATVNITINDLDDAPNITPSPASTAMSANANYRFRVSARTGVEGVVVRDAPGNSGGDITLHSTEAGLTCSNQSNELPLASAAEFWVRACSEGTATISIEEQDSAVDIRTYTATIGAAQTAPEAISDLAGDPGDAQVVLTWTAPHSGGSAITAYDYSTDDGATWRRTGSTATSYTATHNSFPGQANAPLVNGQTYLFLVRAVNAIGAAHESNQVSATPATPTVPGAPTGLYAVAGNTEVVLDWNVPVDDGGEAITDYEYSSDNGSTWSSTGSSSDTEYTVTGLTNGTPVYLPGAGGQQRRRRPAIKERLGDSAGCAGGSGQPERQRRRHRGCAVLDRRQRQRLGHHPLRGLHRQRRLAVHRVH